MAQDTVLHRWFEEVWNQGRESAIEELMAEDAWAHGLVDAQGQVVRGPAAFRSVFHQFRTAFPDIRISVEDALVDGDKIAVRCVVTGSHTGHGLPTAPTNRRTQITGMCMVRVKDGKIAEGWNNFDFLALYQQLGMQLS